ncbi:unnamed protein product [Lymnaea stagnalis]|uniref:C2H2-type domain-containing protein n=1 Tax=Lymnaea stagnalis TaxID=6523 RepID=A0AAV2I4C1_LYMST
MSYTDYQHTSSGAGYKSSYSHQYNTTHYSAETQGGQYASSAPGQYEFAYTTDPYPQATASVPTNYNQLGYDSQNASASTNYAPASTNYAPASTNYAPYSYSQESARVDQSPVGYDNVSVGYQPPPPMYANRSVHDPPSQTPTDFGSYTYQQAEYNPPARSYQDSQDYAGSYQPSATSGSYSYQETPAYTQSGWTSSNQYGESSNPATFYNGSVNYEHKKPFENAELPVTPTGYFDSRTSAHDDYLPRSETYPSNDRYSVAERSNEFSVYKPDPVKSFTLQQNYDTDSPGRYNRSSNQTNLRAELNYSSAKTLEVVNALTGLLDNLNAPRDAVRGAGRGGIRGLGNRFGNRGGDRHYNRENGAAQAPRKFPVKTEARPKGPSSFGQRGSMQKGHSENFAGRGAPGHRGSQPRFSNKPTGFDARSRINEVRSMNATSGKVTNRPFKTQKTPTKKGPAQTETFKAPSRPQDRLLNEIEEREKAKKAEEQKKSPEELKRGEEEARRAAEAAKKLAEEEFRKKLAEEAVKAAPPSKPPETPEEIAREEEIQRKIRESVVIISPEQELALLKDDPSKDVEMPDQLRKLLKTLATNYLCKLCSVRIVGPQMATMHYNGKNHLKKLRNFVQTNGRSAGFNMETSEKADVVKKQGEVKTEIVEMTDADEKKYCKMCKVSFSQESQADMHYQGKNHAKRMKSIGAANGPEVFECKICCVTVTAQEHLTAHLNGARHKIQVRKMDTNENYRGGIYGRGRVGLGFRGRGSKGAASDSDGGEWRSLVDHYSRGRGRGGKGRGSFRGNFRGKGRAQDRNTIFGDYDDEELLSLFGIDPAKKYKFDLANYRTPIGWLYCSSCNISLVDEPQFLLHLGSKEHHDCILGRKKAKRFDDEALADITVSRSS